MFLREPPAARDVTNSAPAHREDIPLNLEISDVIRSKTVQPKEAMRSLKKRIGNKNPNTQLSALNLTDTCVKNGGSHFLVEIASREFMDNLVSLLHAVGPAAVNHDVRGKILELIQSWAAATENRYELKYIDETYKALQREGYQFPPRVTVASSMIDSSAPPEWIDSDVCMRCRTPFTFTNRKHHCRNCGNCFDQQCSTKTLPLPHLGIMQPVGQRAPSLSQERTPTSPSFPHKDRSASVMQPRNARVDDAFDEDLKKALAMSLEEVQNHSALGKGYVPNKTNTQPAKSPAPEPLANKAAEEEEDDLKAAIAASLADMEEQKKRHAAALKEQANSSQPVATGAPFVLPRNDYELSPVEAENINLFSTLVDRLQTQPPGTILREPQIQELYDSIGALRPKLARTYGETMSKHDTLLDLHAKLSTVVRYYDRMLEERLSKTYSQHSIGGYNLPTPRQSSGAYPPAQPNAPSHTGPAESFYTGEQADYARGPPGHNYNQHPTQVPQPQQFFGYDKRASMSMPPVQYPQQAIQRSESWQNQGQIPAPSAPAQFGNSGYGPNEQAMQTGHAPAHAAPLQSAVNRGPDPATSIADPNAAFYYANNPSQDHDRQTPSLPGDSAPSPYPNLQQPTNYNIQSIPPTPASVPAQPSQPSQPPQQYQPPLPQQQQQQQPYWQQSKSQGPPSSYQPPNTAYPGYPQETFPSAPQHTPQQPAVEESLIDL
ncbi:Vacuolar protein sorting-associated protein 27 [Apiospora kogelbergensis]|uniref:Vacuolar protein sorting-associated protein 27 n=1 Tax=Apiospora kogelbergensis TaxID=1337665 RepID=UPI00312FCF99